MQDAIGDVATDLVAELRSVIQFAGSYRVGHPEWPDLPTLRRKLPERLSQPLFELDAAEDAHSLLEHERKQAQRGITYNAMGERFRDALDISAAKGAEVMAEIQREFVAAHEAARARWIRARKEAQGIESETANAMDEIDNKLISEWVAIRRLRIESLHGSFEDWFRRMRRHLDGLGLDRRQVFGGRAANSACEILHDISQDTVKLVAGDRPVAPSAWDELLLDRDGWDGLLRAVRNEVAMVLPRLPHQQMPAVPPSAKHDPKVSRVKGDASVLGQQTRTRLRRLEILRLLPTRTNKDIVASLDGFGQGGPDDSTVSKDITAMRSAGAIHATRLDRTTKGDEVLRMHST